MELGSPKIFFSSHFSLSPSHLETRSDDDIARNVELFASDATAFAKKDFPVPGGYNVSIYLFHAHLRARAMRIYPVEQNSSPRRSLACEHLRKFDW